LISVIVPAFNARETLGPCLRALHAQTHPADEIIVVDDGSTDGTAELARRYDVHVIRQANAGPAAARNAGARTASGDLLLFTDADCVPCPDWIARMVNPFADDSVAGAKGVYRSTQTELVSRFVQIEYEDRYDRMSKQDSIDFVDTYSAAYRRELFLESGGFDTTFPTASVEDQEFSFRLAEAGHRLVFVPDACVTHTHDRTVTEYIRRKFWIGYWKARVTRRYPSKLVRDSHTPQTLKVQLGLAATGSAFLGLGTILRRSQWARWGLGCWAAFGLSTLPFVQKAWSKDQTVALGSPLLLFVRAWALGAGFFWGNLRGSKAVDRVGQKRR
jgi:cellulose synthase/poly-beta-1,6-N-acetylglucosamine synthase-like glycosyltransferase